MLGSEAKGRDISSILSNIMTSMNLRPGQTIDFDKFFELFSSNNEILDEVHLQGKSTNRIDRGFSIYGVRPSNAKPLVEKDQLDIALEKQEAKVSTKSFLTLYYYIKY